MANETQLYFSADSVRAGHNQNSFSLIRITNRQPSPIMLENMANLDTGNIADLVFRGSKHMLGLIG